MLVLACGSRNWVDSQRISKAFDDYHIGAGDTLLHGGARGADRMAGNVAAARGVDIRVVRPDWSTGKAAGFARNLAMLDEGPDLVLAFWDGQSRGTWHTVTQARKREIPTVVILR